MGFLSGRGGDLAKTLGGVGGSGTGEGGFDFRGAPPLPPPTLHYTYDRKEDELSLCCFSYAVVKFTAVLYEVSLRIKIGLHTFSNASPPCRLIKWATLEYRCLYSGG